MEYWGKTTPEGYPGISVSDHMGNVGRVARLLAQQKLALLELLGLTVEETSAFAASHDVGKISQGFQQKCPVWMKQNGLQSQASLWRHCESDHSKVSQFSLQNYLRVQGMTAWSAALWAAAAGGHHGRLHKAGERGLAPCSGMMSDDWEVERQKELRAVAEFFGAFPSMEIDQDSAALWWLAGLISVADWIGSDERFFPVHQQVADPENAALIALEHIGFTTPRIRQHLNFQDLFNLDMANSLQKTTYEFITGPGLYVIEAPMGMGKTEAALWCAYRLLSQGDATGIYFALPTQATSNRIHLRVKDFITRIMDSNNQTRLIHGNSWLMEDISVPQTSLFTDEKDGQSDSIARDWFASRKRALLAPFGVGTVDQALLGIVAAKHFFVRRFALAGKVVIIDEVHSYDVYTGTLVNILCRELEKLGCTVIVLSATLTEDRCARIFGKGDLGETDAYPLLTGEKLADEKLTVCPVPMNSADKTMKVSVQFEGREKATTRAVELAKTGGCVLWICDTVASAQADFTSLQQLAPANLFDMGLLHSRYPFYRREELEGYWMERLGKKERQGRGCILVSTQVVEQSVDLDADLMISELAPTDMLLQRLGRLWRHMRHKRPLPAPLLIILEEEHSLEELRSATPTDIKKALGPKALVYAPYILLRSWEVWKRLNGKAITLPHEIRPMLKKTYEDRSEEAEGWLKLANDWFGNDYAKKQQADWRTNVFDILLDDVEGVQTRLNEMPTVSLVLARQVSAREAWLLDGGPVCKDEGRFDLEKARAINRCAVRVPRAALVTEGKLPEHPLPEKYVFGEACWGVVGEDSAVEVPGIGLTKKMLRYTDETGVEILKRGE
jgi:CRISPR-associated endonuclease/helicase Cas3